MPNSNASRVERFRDIASEYCRLLESDESGERVLTSLHVLLPQLCQLAQLLPQGAAGAPIELERPPPDAALERIQSLLGERTYYREVFDPYSSDDAVEGNLHDDLGDIYRELVEGLVRHRTQGADAACWHWRFTFQIHWGENAISAMRALYALSAWHGFPWRVG